MHIAVSWDITASSDRWKQINERFREVLKPYSWTRPLTTFYVVRVDSEHQRKAIQDGLVSVAKTTSETVHFVITPLMSAGRYDGYLPKDTWAEINKRTG